MIHLVDERRSIRRTALADVEADRQKLLCELDDAQAFRGTPLDAYIDVIRTGQPALLPVINHQLAIGGGDGRYFQLIGRLNLTSLLSVPLQAHGRILGAITLLSSRERSYTVSDQKLAEELAHRTVLAVDHARLYRDAQQANRAKDDFLAMLSHELRSPLTSALLCAQMLRKGVVNGVRRGRALETIERNIRLQMRLVGDLLDISRITSGKLLPLSMTKVDLNWVVRSSVEAARPTAEEQGVCLEAQLESVELPVRGDAARLQQIVGNLLSNAIKFTPRGGRVDVRVERTSDCVKVMVQDTGCGISAELLPEIFDRFRQGDSSMTRKHGGLGLGLAIVRHLVENHAGRITAESAGPGHGATFTMFLPRETWRLEDRKRMADRSTEQEPPDIRGLRVLVVDDEDDARAWIAMWLAARGADVATAASAHEALERLEEEGHRDLLISDIAMPDADGYALLRKVRERSTDRADPIPAIALSAYASALDRRRALEAGYSLHIAKPVDPDELLAAVAEVVRRHPVAPAGYAIE